MISNRTLRALGLLLLAAGHAQAQVVTVTLKLDTNRVEVGGSTTLRALAQIIPAKRASCDRIFSWYVDLLQAVGAVAAADFDQLRKPSSDRDPRISSDGQMDGADRRGIYDTFLNLPGAGRDSAVELFAVPVTGLAPGRVTFGVRAGTGVQALSADFIVAPIGGGDPLLAGDYSAATAQLEVVGGQAAPKLSIFSRPLPPLGQQLTITFPSTTDRNHYLESRSDLSSGGAWQPLPSAPHNSGTVLDTNNLPRRFYRLRITP